MPILNLLKILDISSLRPLIYGEPEEQINFKLSNIPGNSAYIFFD